MSLPPELDFLLQRDGFVIFISGAKEKGKTNLALLLAEIAYRFGYRKEIATNIWTESYFVKQITNFPDLKEWLGRGGKKIYILDEAGKHIKKMRFMTDQNQQMMDLIQLIRHYDAGLIGCAPSESFIDNQFLNTDILDAKIRKITQKYAKVHDYLQNTMYILKQIPTTSIKYNSKDIATFNMERKTIRTDLPIGGQMALDYGQGMSYRQVATKYGERYPVEVQRKVKEWLKTLSNK